MRDNAIYCVNRYTMGVGSKKKNYFSFCSLPIFYEKYFRLRRLGKVNHIHFSLACLSVTNPANALGSTSLHSIEIVKTEPKGSIFYYGWG